MYGLARSTRTSSLSPPTYVAPQQQLVACNIKTTCLIEASSYRPTCADFLVWIYRGATPILYCGAAVHRVVQ